MRRLAGALVVSALLGACGGDDGSSSPSPTAPAATATATTATTVFVATTPAGTTATTASETTVAPTSTNSTTTVPEPVVLPAGMQYLDPAVPLPPWAGPATRSESAIYAVGAQATSELCTSPQGCDQVASNPYLYTVEADVSTTMQIDDVEQYRDPSGYSLPLGLKPTGVAVNGRGVVVSGEVGVWQDKRFFRYVNRGLLWFKEDGSDAFRRIELTDLIGGRDAELTAVYATNDGFVAIGAVAAKDELVAPLVGLVLTSPDGSTWNVAAELPLTWSVALSAMAFDETTMVLRGSEYACNADATPLNQSTVGAQTRIWTSQDAATTWDLLDLEATGLADDMPDVPTESAQCPTDLIEVRAVGWNQFPLFGVGDGMVTLGATDLVHVAVGIGDSFVTAELPGAPPPQDTVALRLAGADEEGLYVVSVETGEGGYQGRGWRSDDGGASWQELPRPTAVDVGQPAGLVPGGDGSALLRGSDNMLFVSEAGPLLA